jgi:Zn-dependent protease
MDFDPSPHADPPRFGPAPPDPDETFPLRASGPPAVPPPYSGFMTSPAAPVAELADGGPPPPPPPPISRRIALPVLLFIMTCGSTFWIGLVMFGDLALLLVQPDPRNPAAQLRALQQFLAGGWQNAVVYMLAVMGILLAHEMGHFLQAVRYRVPASLPYFIPMPISVIGTMGAVIGMRGLQADRKELFDIGLSGPWAGLVLAIPISIAGVITADPFPLDAPVGLHLQDPLAFKMLMWFLRDDLLPGQELHLNPLLHAGWVGMLITGLNMLPISQLDGGHVAYAVLGRRAHWLARGVALAAILFIVVAQQYGWILMLFLVLLIGVKHPPTSNDDVPLGWPRIVIGTVSLIIPVLCLAPIPIS